MWTPILLILAFSALAYLAGKMDLSGSIAGFFIAFGIWLGGGYAALGLLFLFFVMGISASRWRREWKTAQGIAQEGSGKRSAKHALANGGVAMLCGLGAWAFPAYADYFLIALAGSLSAATADTLSSEIGNVLGSRYVNLLSFRPDERGRDGVISLEGSLAGLAGSTILALAFWVAASGMAGPGEIHLPQVLIIIAAGQIGNLTDSLLGATLERRGLLNNEAVNVGCTLAGAMFAVVVMVLVF